MADKDKDKECEKYKQALDEIKLICDRTCKICEIFKMCDKEFSNCKNARILNIIKSAKDINVLHKKEGE